MDCANLVPPDLHNFYDFREWRNPCAVLSVAFFGEAGTKGGGKSLVAIRMDQMFLSKGWKPMEFDTKIVVNDRPIESPTHEVDCFKGKVALELEWNNKTEFYDRDLNNFRLLFDLRVVDVGIIITRCDELQEIFDELGRGSSYGRTTTILSKLQRKLDGSAGGGCPVLAIGMRKSLYLDDILRPDLAKEFKRIERRVKKIRWKLKEQ